MNIKAPEFPLCEDCGVRYVIRGEDYCPDCYSNRAEAYWEAIHEDGECFRGGEAAAYEAEQAWKAKREAKG